MFFSIKVVKGIPYVYQLRSIRRGPDKKPTNDGRYIGSLEKIETVINSWRQKNGRE